MERTGEIILTTIGLILNLIGMIIMIPLLFFTNTNEFKNSFIDGFIETASEEGLSASTQDINALLNLFLGMGWFVFIVLLIGLIMGIIALYFFIGNKKPKAASVIMIITSLIIVVGTLLTGFMPALLYLIAGIIGLVRKTPLVNIRGVFFLKLILRREIK